MCDRKPVERFRNQVLAAEAQRLAAVRTNHRVRHVLLGEVGQCLGGGLELASYCTWVFATPNAQLGQPEIKLAVFAPLASLLLPQRVGRPAATDLLLSGRWFRSKSEAGPWTFVRADELPPSFQDIPPASDIGGLRTSVAGTEEADDAIRDAAIPQTSAIKRSEASLTVEYDGAPKFESIEGTAVSYAVNTGAQVLLIGGRYYAADNGVWFTSAAATGPWVRA